MVAASIGIAVGIGGIVWATIPDVAGVIHACYKAQNGQLRIVDVSQGQGWGERSRAGAEPRRGPRRERSDGTTGRPDHKVRPDRRVRPGRQDRRAPPGRPAPTGATGAAGSDSTKTVSGAINPDGTSQLANSQFTSSRVGAGHYRRDFPPGVFDFIPNIVVMPIGKAFVSESIEFGTGGGAFGIEVFTVGIDSNQLQDTLVNFIATPFTNF